MGYRLELATFLTLPLTLGESELRVGDRLRVIKTGEKIYPMHTPLEFCDENHKYLGEIILSQLTLEKSKTLLYGKIIKMFTEAESQVYSRNFLSLQS